MNELNSIESQPNLDAIPLSDQVKFRLNEISKIKDYFNSEVLFLLQVLLEVFTSTLLQVLL